MKIGDLVKYNVDQFQNDVPGMVVGFEHTDSLEYLQVQWFDWDEGQIAVESPCALVMVSKAE